MSSSPWVGNIIWGMVSTAITGISHFQITLLPSHWGSETDAILLHSSRLHITVI